MLTRILSVFLAFTTLQPVLLAELPDAPAAVQAKTKADLQKLANEQRKVTLTLNGAKVTGKVQEIGQENFQFTNAKTREVTRVNYSDVTEVRKAGMSKGAKIALGIGIGVGAAIGLGILAACNAEGGPQC